MNDTDKCWVCKKIADGQAKMRIGWNPGPYSYGPNLSYCWVHLSEITDFLEAIVKDWRYIHKHNRELIKKKIDETESTEEEGADRKGIDGNLKGA